MPSFPIFVWCVQIQDEPNLEILLQSRVEHNISVPGTMEEDDIIVLFTNNFSRRQS